MPAERPQRKAARYDPLRGARETESSASARPAVGYAITRFAHRDANAYTVTVGDIAVSRRDGMPSASQHNRNSEQGTDWNFINATKLLALTDRDHISRKLVLADQRGRKIVPNTRDVELRGVW